MQEAKQEYLDLVEQIRKTDRAKEIYGKQQMGNPKSPCATSIAGRCEPDRGRLRPRSFFPQGNRHSLLAWKLRTFLTKTCNSDTAPTAPSRRQTLPDEQRQFLNPQRFDIPIDLRVVQTERIIVIAFVLTALT